jgi:hypothetical protein
MPRIRPAFRSSVLMTSVALLARAARAGSPDPRTLRDQLEEHVLDADMDAEDIAVLPLTASTVARPRRAVETYVSVDAFVGRRFDGQREFGGFVVLQLALERFASKSPAEPRGAADVVASDSLPSDLGKSPAGEQLTTGLSPPAGLSQTAGDHPERPATGSVVLTTEVARTCVRAAWRTLGIADDVSIDSMASRARTSAALPELRLRAMRTVDESGRVTLSDTDPFRYTEAGTATSWLEARLTFRLDRLIFADEEVSLERVRVERSELRARAAAKVLQALFEWQRAYALVQEPAISSAEHFAAILRELEASAILDVMTDGWFGRFRASIDAKSP